MIPLLLLLAAATSTTSVASKGFALVIGSNHPLPGSGYDILKYADDDALRYAELFEGAGIETVVLTAPDPETAERFPELAARAERPTRGQVDVALARIEAKLAEAEGTTRELYFVFSGHGSISSTLAYLHLFDGKFTRVDVFEQILKRMPAERIHVIIDSCHSYFLVNSRGRRTAIADDEEDLDLYPSTGFLLSTSGNREVQEWAGYRAGVFSHQLLGALRGAADVDLDGVVTYDEAHAYIVAANLDVERDDARIQPYVRRPTTRGKVLIDLGRDQSRTRTTIPSEISGHFHILDAAGVRILDANKAAGTELRLALPDRPLYLHTQDALYAIEKGSVARVEPPAEGVLAQSKGTIADELRTNLFKTPLTEDFVRGLSAATHQVTHVHRSSEGSWSRDPITLGLLGGGSAALIAGAVSTVFFNDALADSKKLPITRETEGARERAGDLRLAMGVTYAGGGALILAGVLRALITNQEEERVAITLGPAEVGLYARF